MSFLNQPKAQASALQSAQSAQQTHHEATTQLEAKRVVRLTNSQGSGL